MTEGIWRERIFDAKTDFWHMSSQVWTWISMQSSNTESKRYFCKAWMWNGQIVSFGWFNVHRIGAEMRAFWRVSASLSQFWLLEVVRGVHVPRKIARRIHFWGFLSSKMSILRATSIFHRTDACATVPIPAMIPRGPVVVVVPVPVRHLAAESSEMLKRNRQNISETSVC